MCGLTRDTVTTASASRAFLSQKTGSPQLLVPMRHGGHVGLDRHAERLFADAVLREQFALAFRRRAAVTAHRRDDERLRAKVAQACRAWPARWSQVGDAAAADADRHAHAAPQPARQPGAEPLLAHLGGNIGDDGLRGNLTNQRQGGSSIDPSPKGEMAARRLEPLGIVTHRKTEGDRKPIPSFQHCKRVG